MPYAAALSKPFPCWGLLSMKWGGKAGLWVATVSCPGVLSASLSFVQAPARAEEAPPEPVPELDEEPPPLLPQAARARAANDRVAAASGRRRVIAVVLRGEIQVAGERRERSPQSRLAKARMILADVSTEQAITLALAGDT